MCNKNKKIRFSCPSSQARIHSWLSPLAAHWQGYLWVCSMSIKAPLCCFSLLIVFPHFQWWVEHWTHWKYLLVCHGLSPPHFSSALVFSLLRGFPTFIFPLFCSLPYVHIPVYVDRDWQSRRVCQRWHSRLSSRSGWAGVWANWCSWKCSLQGSWTRWDFTVPSNPNFFLKNRYR